MTDRHGTVLGYKLDGCRCDDCTAASVQYQARLQLRRLRGEIWEQAADTRRACEQVAALQPSATGLAQAAGSGVRVAAKVLEGEGKIRCAVAAKFHGLTPDDLPDTCRVSGDRVRELLAVLRERGMCNHEIARDVFGWPRWPGDTWEDQDTVTMRLFRKVDAAVGCWRCGSADRWGGGRFCHPCLTVTMTRDELEDARRRREARIRKRRQRAGAA